MGALLDALPAGGSASSDIAREVMLLQYVLNGQASWSWSPVTWVEGGHTIVMQVMTDALKVEGVRIDASATLSQRIADVISAVLPTAKMWDILWQKADVKLKPLTRTITSTTANMIDQSARIDAAIGERTGIVANAGKCWALTNQLLQDSPGCGGGAFPPVQVPNVAANYGWYVSKGSSPAVTPGLRVIQSLSRCHSREHTDYSQLLQLFAMQCTFDGYPVDIRDILTGPYASIISQEGPLLTVRQPGTDQEEPSPPIASSGGGGTIPVGYTPPTPTPAPTPKPATSPTAAYTVSPSAGIGFGGAMATAFVAALAAAVAYRLVT